MGKWTQGPWVAKPGDGGGILRHIVRNATREAGARWIASVTEIDGVEDQANAKLIACAPELVEVLRQTLDMLTRYHPTDDSMLAMHYKRIRARARNLLLKVEEGEC